MWALVARAIDRARTPLSVMIAGGAALLVARGTGGEGSHFPIAVATAVFLVVIVVAIVALTALLAVAEHRAQLRERAATEGSLPIAVATVRARFASALRRRSRRSLDRARGAPTHPGQRR
jgi:uncharacterized membrane protein